MVVKVAFGFRPNDEELVGYFLRHKIEGNTSLVDEFINEVNICSFDPWDLRFESKYKSKDPMWYFFSRRENKYGNGDRQNRTTKSGKWKIIGEPVKVTDHWGISSGFPGVIGSKKVLSFIDARFPKKTKSDWIIHEFHFHCDLLPHLPRTYVICRLHYKGDDPAILLANATAPTPTLVPNMSSSEGSVVNQSFHANSGSYNTYPENDSTHHVQQFNENFNLQPDPQGNFGSFDTSPGYDSAAFPAQHFGLDFDMQQSVQGNLEPFNHLSVDDIAKYDQWLIDYTNQQQQTPYSATSGNELQQVIGNYEYVFDERTYMQENYSAYRPKKTETGIITDDSSDTENGSMIFEDTSSSTDSVGSSNESNHTPKDDIPSLIEPLHNYEAQEQPKQSELPCQSKEKVKNTEKRECEWKMAEDSMKKPASCRKMVKQSWIVMEKISQRNSQWNNLMNMIIGFVLFISIMGWIILVG